MIRLLEEKDRKILLDYLYQEPEYNIFPIGDIEAFGFDKDFQRIYGEFNQEKQLISILLRYKENTTYYSDKLIFNLDYLEIFKLDPFKFISGKTELMKLIHPYLTDFVLERMYFCKASEFNHPLNDDVHKIRLLKTKEDAGKLYDLISCIEEFSLHLRNKVGFVDAKMNSMKMGTTLFIEKSGKIISTVATTADTTISAMVVSVATDKEFRNQGLVSELMMALMDLYINKKNKSLCLFYDNVEAGKIYLRLGFKTIGTWDMYHQK
ncbi:MAG: GNAT family N-acetyltransferase [Tenericutes bacterium]|nr:GNAT family N-acetyltransferase [Mycoplasmatota bacterium]